MRRATRMGGTFILVPEVLMHLSHRRIAALALAALFVLAVAACGGSSSSNTTSSTTTSTTTATTGGTAAAEVPAAIKSKGTLSVAADATYAPNEFVGSDGKTVVGMDADLAKAIVKQLGLKANVVNATFATIIPGLASGKYDLGMSSFTDTKEREKTVDFVTYFSAGTAFYVKKGGPTINSLADLCGHSVGVERGTTQADDAKAQDAKCKQEGKPGVTVAVYTDQSQANLAISSGRQQVGMADSPVAAYIVKQSKGQFVSTGKAYNTAPYGIAIPKGNGMAQPVLDAVKELIANGTYASILKKWGVSSGAISNPQINGAVS
jgi:polar amino acid transport system substrate-binding protein